MEFDWIEVRQYAGERRARPVQDDFSAVALFAVLQQVATCMGSV